LEFKIITGMKSCQAHLGFIDYVLTQPRRGDIIVDNRFYYTRNPEGGDIIKRKANNVTLSGFDIYHLHGTTIITPLRG
jgi:hypothetical protein